MKNKSYYKKLYCMGRTISGIVVILFLFYMVSCSSEDASSPSSNVLPPIKSLTLNAVSEDSISLDWALLTTDEGVVDLTVIYTVYVQTLDERGAFTNILGSEKVYTLLFPLDLGEGKMSIPLAQDSTGRRASGIKVEGLINHTPYRIVVEARDVFGTTSRSELLAYTASALTNADISGVKTTTTIDSDEVIVSWDSKEGAQSYLIQASEDENQFGGSISVDKVLAVVCPLDSLLCEKKTQFAEPLGDDKLEYRLQVNKKGRYKLAIIPFNFRDLAGLQAVDESGVEKTFIEEVLAQVEDESSTVGARLTNTIQDPTKAEEVQIQVSVAGAPTDLVLESTGDTLSASWGHGIGAEYYYAIITSNDGVNAFTNTIDRYDASGKFAGGGYIGFSGLTTNTAYTVTVQSFTVIDNVTNLGGEISATLSTKDISDTLNLPVRIAGENLILTNGVAGTLGVTWNTEEANSVIGYNVFYWVGEVAPNQPQFVAVKGQTNLSFTVPPGRYNVKVDVLSIYPRQEVVAGETSSITVYGKPLSPQDLGVNFARGNFINIGNRLYAVGYPLAYTEVKTSTEAGGPVEDIKYQYRYRVEGGEWVGYSEIAGEAMISLQVDDLDDASVIKSGYGKKYQVEVITSNAGGFVSDAGAFEFAYKSFPEPFIQSDHLEVETGDRSLTVTWSEVNDLNGSTVSSYTVVLNVNPYELPVQSVTTVERVVVFENLVNNQPYLITVIPNGTVTGNLLTALSVVTGYTIGEAIVPRSQEEGILGAYTGIPTPYILQGAPEAVVNLWVVPDIDNSQVTVSWDEPAQGSLATGYVLEYLTNIRTLITNTYITGDVTDAELSGLSWGRAVSIKITNISDSYSQVISNLNVLSATNVFRVKGVRVDASGGELSGRYRYYALGTGLSRAPSTVGELTFSEYTDRSFKVIWNEPDDPGEDGNKNKAHLAGYRVSWGTTEDLGDSFDIYNPAILSHTITNLIPGTQYYVKVQARNDNVRGYVYNTGSTESIYTLKKPGMVATITYSGHTTNGFKVKWDAVTDAGYGSEGALVSVGYLLEHSSNQGRSWRSVVRSDYLATEETLVGLSPGISYQVRVIVTNGFIAGDARVGHTWTTALPGQVGDMEVSDPTYDETTHQGGFKVSWEAPLDTGRTSTGEPVPVTGYEVTYAEVVDGVRGEYTPVTHEDLKTEYVFTGLKANAEYDIRIQTKNTVGSGEGNHVSAWVPSPPEEVNPESIVFSHPTPKNIQITWDAPQPGRAGGSLSIGATNLYKVEIVPDEDKENEDAYSLVQDNYSTTNITVSNLTPSTAYRARITAKNTWGSLLAYLSISTGTTLDEPTPPSKVEGLGVKSFTDSEVVLSWAAPTNAGTAGRNTLVTISGYKVKYKTPVDSNYIEIDKTGEGEGIRLQEALTRASSNATVIGLSGNTEYYFLVAAINSVGVTTPDAEAATKFQTMAIPAPENLRKLTCVKTTSVDLGWDAPSVSIDSSYNVSYKLYRDGNLIDTITNNTYTDDNLIPGTPYTYKVQACKDTVCSGDSEPLPIITYSGSGKYFRNIIDSGQIPTDLPDYDERSREIFSPYNRGTSFEVRYLKPDGSGDETGSSFENAAGNPKTVIDSISDAAANKVYLVLLAGGTYNPGTMAMKNHVAIVGGVNECLDSFDSVTTLDGERTRQVFNNKDLTNTALLYGVTIANGQSDSITHGGGMHNSNASPTLTRVVFSGNTAIDGGGMHNESSSPVLTDVTFSGNTATSRGGGMHNESSSPVLTNVAFSRNTAKWGGGMHNKSSSPVLTDVTFSGNSTSFTGGGMFNENSSPFLRRVTFSGNIAKTSGGGMYNMGNSSPILTDVTFSGNKANSFNGGGMYNKDSSPHLVGVTFFENNANSFGGGMFNDNNGRTAPYIINGIFWGNTVSSSTGSGPEFYFHNDGSQQENLHIYNSIVKGGFGTLETGDIYPSVKQGGFVSGGGSASVIVFFDNIIDADPQLEALMDKGGSVMTRAIQKTSPAVNQGLFVRKKGSDYYYSEKWENNTWYKNNPDLSGTLENPPADAENLTATDATGHARTDRPDLGAYEAR